MSELKSCPFCGGTAELHKRYHSIEEIVDEESAIPKDAKYLYKKITPEKEMYFFRRKLYIPRCVDTRCIGRNSKPFFNKDEAIEAWNRRADNG